MSHQTQTQNQASFDDISYDEHIRTTPSEDRIANSFDSQSGFYKTVEKGDVLWVDEDEFVVAGFGPTFFGPKPVLLVNKSNQQTKRMVVGGLEPDDDTTYAAWTHVLSALPEDKDPNVSHTIGEIENRVFELENETLESLHSWVPDSETRECPVCEDGLDGTPLHLEVQNNTFIEIRQCTNTDCHHVYRYTQTNPDTSPATVVEHDARKNAFSFATVEGLFSAEEQDDFKIPLETHDGRDDGFYTPQQIADFLNPKFIPPQILEYLGTESMPLSALLEPARHDLPEDTSTEDVTEAFVALIDKLLDDNLIGADNMESVNGTMLLSSDGDIETAVIDDVTVPTQDVLTHSAFYTYVTETLREPFGVTEVKTNWSDERVVEWDDEAGFSSMMTVTFTEMDFDPDPYSISTFYHLNRKGVDYDEYAAKP